MLAHSFQMKVSQEPVIIHQFSIRFLNFIECWDASYNMKLLIYDFEVLINECRTTRPADNSDRDKSARMLRQLGPYYCFIILFNIYMCIIIDLFLKDNYYLLVKMNYLLNDNIKWPKMWLGRDCVLMTWSITYHLRE